MYDQTRERLSKQRQGAHVTVGTRRMVRAMAGNRWWWVDVQTGDTFTTEHLAESMDRYPDQPFQLESSANG